MLFLYLKKNTNLNKIFFSLKNLYLRLTIIYLFLFRLQNFIYLLLFNIKTIFSNEF